MKKNRIEDLLKEKIDRATKKMFAEWKKLDKPQKISPEQLTFYQKLDKIIKHETGLQEGEMRVKKSIEKVFRNRKDLGTITIGETVIKKIQIVDEYHYEGNSKPLKSIAYYQLLPLCDAQTPLVRLLQWKVTHQQQWVIWFTSPVAKGLSTRTRGEYIIIYSLTDKESENYDLLLKFSKFPCFGRSDGIDVLLGFEELNDAVDFIEEFLPAVVSRNLYSDPEFLKFLGTYQQTVIAEILV